MTKPKKCRFCPQEIVMLLTSKQRLTPVESIPQVRTKMTPLLRGKYYDAQGRMYDYETAPYGVSLWRSHWAECPGRNEARKKHNKEN